MSSRFRIGPFSVGTGGRVGASVGPVSVSGGGRRRRGNPAGWAGPLIFVIAFVVALVATSGGGGGHHEPLTAAQRAHAITRQQYTQARVGQRRADVLRRLGPPEPKARLRAVTTLWAKVEHLRHCLYYNMTDGPFGDVYELCFDTATPRRLISRSMYFDAS